MNSYTNNRNESRLMTPLMAMPNNGHVIWAQAEPYQGDRKLVHTETVGWKQAGLIMLALILPLVLLSMQAFVF
jgi:hypothetical protein